MATDARPQLDLTGFDTPPFDTPPVADPSDTPPVDAPTGDAPTAQRGTPPARPVPLRRTRSLRLTAAFGAVALLGGVAGAATSQLFDDRGPAVRATASASGTVDRAASTLAAGGLDIAGVIAKAEPSVVSISVAGRSGSGAGTGVILTTEGEILTNAHVVAGASQVRVTLAGETQSRTAEIVGLDQAADLALLRIPGASDLPAAELGSSSALQVGDDVVAIGNALALRGNPTVTSGIVSGLNRSLETASGTMTGLLQTDASISSGNSGGPLVNASGQVIGINTAVAASSGRTAAENVGFAIAIDEALPVIDRLRAGTSAEQTATAVLGVRTSDPTDGSRGALIASVEPGSAAADGGLEAGDLVIRLGDRAVEGAASLTAAVRARQPGDVVDVTVVRDGDTRTIQVTLGG